MTKFARFTLTTMLLGSLTLPAVAQNGATSSVPMQPTVRVLPGLHHRTAGHSSHVHRVADAVRTPAATSGTAPALPPSVAGKNIPADGKTAMGSSTGTHGKDAMTESKSTAMPVAPTPAPSTSPHAAGAVTTNPAQPYARQ